jgi:pyridinium-3,5-biscarboxylic acid mononucleotide sulfurtransferase
LSPLSDGAPGRKYGELLEYLRGIESPLIAYSGGVDSTFLLRAGLDALGPGVRAVLGRSPSVAPEILERAGRVAARLGVDLRVVDTPEMENPAYLANNPDRCFHCKDTLFRVMEHIREASDGDTILDGTNQDDLADTRPGIRAARLHGVRSPLAELGWTKQEIREASRCLELETWNLPSSPCLSSRIPHGTPVTEAALVRIGDAERGLRALGFGELRVRHHGPVARIEVPPADLEKILARRREVLDVVRAAGYFWVTLDLEGYRTGGADPGAMGDPGPTDREGRADGGS